MALKIKLVDCEYCGGTGKQPAEDAREQLRTAREKAGVSMRSLATAMGVSYGYLGDIERGNRKLTPLLAVKYSAKLEELKNGNN